MRDLKFVAAQPDDVYYTWQVHLWLESLRKLGHSDKAIVLVFIPSFRDKNTKWDQIVELYPEAEFCFYKDVDDVSKLLGIYIPILRPYVLSKYFTEHPEMKDKAVFYCDCDILFTDKFNLDKFLEDDVNYLSDTNSYINASYFDSKVKDVLPEKLEDYKKIDVLNETAGLVGINRTICEKNNLHSGGAQYLLKNVDGQFWNDVMTACIKIRVHLMNVNKAYFENENKGFQSWCADMWAVLWNLWARDAETRVIPEMDFAWAPDPIEKLERTTIYHNAGVTDGMMGGIPYFYKGAYHLGKDPFKDPHLHVVYHSEESKKKCTHFYTSELLALKEKYNLNY